MVKADLQDFPGLVVIFQDFPVLENAKVKFQDFPGFPGPARTLKVELNDLKGDLKKQAATSQCNIWHG